ncbi:MAG TPA: hypothetical protein VN855_00545 [Candidatus Acidoferrum sp.]|nr:hypothetical protein [Candidatus Acidoferrum sp.]
MPILIWCLMFCSGCTFNISMAHTEGSASDVIDDTQAPTNDIAPQLQIPMIGK